MMILRKSKNEVDKLNVTLNLFSGWARKIKKKTNITVDKGDS